MTQSFEKTTIGEIVAADSRAAAVFEQFGIDFCCGGRRSIAEACHAAAVDPAAVEHALRALPVVSEQSDGVLERELVTHLIDHIVEVHHSYVRTAIPLISRYLAKLVEVHGARHPELTRIAETFDHVGHDLSLHMLKEERVLFPYICEL